MLSTPDVRNLNEQVYDPAEDLFLLLDSFEQEQSYLTSRFKSPIIFEIGTGLGIVLSFLQKHIFPNGYNLASDINPHACVQAQKTFADNNTNGVEMMQMSCCDGIRTGVVDVLVFNPPYVPAEEVPALPNSDSDPTWLDLALLGGKDGMVTTWPVLNTLDGILLETGVAYILFCARNHPLEVAKIMVSRGWNVETILHRKAGWEVLLVLRFSR